jgi:DNA-binding response OmpR family regulator
MVMAVICSPGDVEQELGHTLLWRGGMERRVVRTAEEARSLAPSRPQLLVLDRDVAGAEALVAQLRTEPGTRAMSIVIMARGDFEAGEIGLLEAGANAILRLPAQSDWDERLRRLVDVPVRRESRFSVFFKVETTHGDQSAIMATALNLSSSGMLIETTEPLGVGEQVSLQFRLPELDALVKATGRVVRLAGPRRFGLEFGDLAPAASESIRKYVDR